MFCPSFFLLCPSVRCPLLLLHIDFADESNRNRKRDGSECKGTPYGASITTCQVRIKWLQQRASEKGKFSDWLEDELFTNPNALGPEVEGLEEFTIKTFITRSLFTCVFRVQKHTLQWIIQIILVAQVLCFLWAYAIIKIKKMPRSRTWRVHSTASAPPRTYRVCM